MKFLTNFIIALIGLIVLSGIGFFCYQFYEKLHAPAASPFNAIPANSALIIKINKPSRFWNDSRHSNKLWHDLFQIPLLASLEHRVNTFDSILQKNKRITEGIRNNPLFIILTPTISNPNNLLFLINLNEDLSEDFILEYLEETWQSKTRIEKTSYAGSSIFGVFLKNHKPFFYFTIKNKLFIASSQAALVKQSIDRLSLNLATEEDPEFRKVTASSGKNVDVNIFIHYPVIAPFVNNYSTGGPLADFLSVANFASWSGLDLIQKQDHWLISGYSVCKDNSAEYLFLFSGQSPQKISMTNIIPDDAMYFSWLGLSDAGLYHEKLALSQTKTPIYLPLDFTLSAFEKEKQIRFQDYFLSWVGNEIGLVTMLNNTDKKEMLNFGIFGVNDRVVADSSLQALIKLGSKQKPAVTYKTHKIHSLSIQGIIPMVWGNLFNKLEESCFTFIDNYVIFGKDEFSMQKFIDRNSSGNTIGKNDIYRNFSANISDQVNLYFYCNMVQSYPQIQSILTDNINQEIAPVKDSLKKFESFGVQITNKDDNFFTNLFIQYSQSEQNKGPLVWQTPLENRVAGKPQIIANKLTGKPAVLALDDGNILYLVDQGGAVQWKLNLPGKPCGDIQILSIKNGDSLLFVFNTENHICIVDNNGLFAYNTPFSLPGKASAGLLVSSSINSGSESLIIPLLDKKIYAFNLNGKQISDWQKPLLSSIAVRPVQQIQVKGKTYFICSGSDGNIVITNEHGKSVIVQKSHVLFSSYSSFFINKTNNKGDFLTTTNDGELVYLNKDGRTSQVKFNNFTPNHYFFYHDVNEDKVQEFIYFDLNKLYCYNKFKKLLYDYTFPPFTEKPFIIRLPNGDQQIGAVSPKSGDVFLFNKKGVIFLDPVIRGNTPFDIGMIDAEQGTSLVIGEGKYIKNYLLTKH